MGRNESSPHHKLSQLRALVHDLAEEPELAQLAHEYVRAHLSPGGGWDTYRTHVACTAALQALYRVEDGSLPIQVEAVNPTPRGAIEYEALYRLTANVAVGMHLAPREGGIGGPYPRIVSVRCGSAWIAIGTVDPWLNPAGELLAWWNAEEPDFWIDRADAFTKGDTQPMTVSRWRDMEYEIEPAPSTAANTARALANAVNINPNASVSASVVGSNVILEGVRTAQPGNLYIVTQDEQQQPVGRVLETWQDEDSGAFMVRAELTRPRAEVLVRPSGDSISPFSVSCYVDGYEVSPGTLTTSSSPQISGPDTCQEP